MKTSSLTVYSQSLPLVIPTQEESLDRTLKNIMNHNECCDKSTGPQCCLHSPLVRGMFTPLNLQVFCIFGICHFLLFLNISILLFTQHYHRSKTERSMTDERRMSEGCCLMVAVRSPSDCNLPATSQLAVSSETLAKKGEKPYLSRTYVVLKPWMSRGRAVLNSAYARLTPAFTSPLPRLYSVSKACYQACLWDINMLFRQKYYSLQVGILRMARA